MQTDLNQLEPHRGPFRARVCIVGAGIAGLTLASRLAAKGIDVALLECGGHALNAATQRELESLITPHAGTREGRFHALGGASLRWGGQLLPLPADAEGPWASLAPSLAGYYEEAQSILGVDDLPFEANGFFAATYTPAPPLFAALPDLETRLSKWIPFPRRNLASTLGRELILNRHAHVCLHAQATELVLAPNGARLEAVLTRTRNGRMFRFEADHFVLAAGTVETVRLLLASRSVAPEGIGNAHDQVGRNFHDHLTLPAASLIGPTRRYLVRELRPWLFDTSRFGNSIFGPSPFGATLHTAKLIAPPELRRELDLNPVLAHLTIDEPPNSGLNTVRELLTSRQRGELRRTLGSSLRHLPGALARSLCLAGTAAVENRRFVSRGASVHLQLNATQDTPSLSRITLSAEPDALGTPLPIVDWRVTAHELHTLRAFAAWLRDRFATVGLTGLDWLPALFDDSAPLPVNDARHAMGGACFGPDPRTSVVDSDLTVHDVANLSIAGCAVFPDGSPQLPTLPLIALTLRLADRLESLH